MKILVKFPTRQRPDKFINTLNKYYELSSNVENLNFLISCDLDDNSMYNTHMIDKLSKYKNLELQFKNNKSKVDAINSGIDEYEKHFDIILLASDDMIPIKKGYDSIIVKIMEKYFPDADGVVWLNDGLQGIRLNTLCILGKKYYDRFGYIYYPEYKSLYCDNEFTAVSRKIGKLVYLDEVLISHDHPFHIKDFDDLYKKNDIHENDDKLLWIERSKKFGWL